MNNLEILNLVPARQALEQHLISKGVDDKLANAIVEELPYSTVAQLCEEHDV